MCLISSQIHTHNYLKIFSSQYKRNPDQSPVYCEGNFQPWLWCADFTVIALIRAVLLYCEKISSKHLYWPWQIIVPMRLILLQSVTFVYLFIYQTNFYEFSFQVSETWYEHNKLLYVEFMVSVTCCTLFHLSFKCIYPILLSTPYLAPSFGADKKMILLS